MTDITLLRLDAKKLAFVVCAASCATHATIEGIRVESTRDGVIVVATDGTVMLAARSEPQDIDVSDVLHVTKEFLDACRLSKADTVTVGTDTWAITDAKGGLVATGICNSDSVHWRCNHTTPDDLPYPQWSRVFCAASSCDQPVYGLTAQTAQQVARAAKVARLGFSLYGSSKSIEGNAPILIVFSVSDYTGLIMPSAGHGAPFAAIAPSWVVDRS